MSYEKLVWKVADSGPRSLTQHEVARMLDPSDLHVWAQKDADAMGWPQVLSDILESLTDAEAKALVEKIIAEKPAYLWNGLMIAASASVMYDAECLRERET